MTGPGHPWTYSHPITLECLQESTRQSGIFFLLFSCICIHRILESDLLSQSTPIHYWDNAITCLHDTWILKLTQHQLVQYRERFQLLLPFNANPYTEIYLVKVILIFFWNLMTTRKCLKLTQQDYNTRRHTVAHPLDNPVEWSLIILTSILSWNLAFNSSSVVREGIWPTYRAVGFVSSLKPAVFPNMKINCEIVIIQYSNAI